MFPVGTAYGYMVSWPLFTPRKTHMCMNLDMWLVAVLFLGETFIASSIIGHMPSTKLCPQCKAAVPVRRTTCERCDHVFRTK